jgi:hypothetical protein
MSAFRAATLLTKEPKTLEEIDRLQPGDIFFDIGASTGPYTMWAAKRGVTVYSFEPNRAELQTNVAMNHLLEYVHFYDDGHNIDQLALPFPTFVKVDIDGDELSILREGRNTISRARSVQVEERDANTEDVQCLMKEMGFSLDYTVQLNYNKKEWNAVYRKNNG